MHNNGADLWNKWNSLLEFSSRSPPLFFEWGLQSNEILLSLGMKMLKLNI
jgi:hypothetical protein